MTTKAFLSYARADGTDAARRLVALLAAEDLSVWRDLREIRSGESV